MLCQDGFAGLNHKHPVKLSDTFFNLVWRHHEYQSQNKASYAGQTINDFFKKLNSVEVGVLIWPATLLFKNQSLFCFQIRKLVHTLEAQIESSHCIKHEGTLRLISESNSQIWADFCRILAGYSCLLVYELPQNHGYSLWLMYSFNLEYSYVCSLNAVFLTVFFIIPL